MTQAQWNGLSLSAGTTVRLFFNNLTLPNGRRATIVTPPSFANGSVGTFTFFTPVGGAPNTVVQIPVDQIEAVVVA